MRSRACFCPIFLLLAGPLGCESEPSTPARAAASSETAPAPAASSAAVSVAPRSTSTALPGWRAGERRRYSLALESDTHLGESPLTEFTLKGALLVTAVDAGADRILLAATLESAAFVTKLEGKQKEFDALVTLLEKPFLFELGRGGVLTALHFPDEPSGLVVGLRQLFAGALQAEVDAKHRVSREEFDATGTYEAVYAPAGTPKKLEKTKTRYLSLHGAADARQDVSRYLPKVVRSLGTLELSESGVVESIVLDEAVRSTGDQMMPLDSSNRLTLERAALEQVKPAALADLAKLVERSAHFTARKPWKAKVLLGANDEARIRGRTLEGVLAAYEKLGPKATSDDAGKDARTRSQTDLFGALEALVRSRPGTTERAVRLIKKGGPAAGPLIDALGSSGDARAQKALYDLIKTGKLDPTLRKLAAISLSRAQHPTEATITALVELLSDRPLRIQAMYGLGTCIRRLREGGEEARAKRALDVVLGSLVTAGDNIAKITALRAVANSGHEAALPAVTPFLQVEDEEVRAAAVESLQIMQLPQIDALLARSLGSDKSSIVRLAAARAFLPRKHSAELEAAAASAALADTDGHVRLGALRALGGWLPAHPAIRQSISRVAASEKQESIRKEAESLLGSRAPAP